MPSIPAAASVTAAGLAAGAETADVYSRVLLAAALPKRLSASSGRLPDTVEEATVRGDTATVRRYRQVCGFPAADEAAAVPITFPSVLAFTPALRLMAKLDFPLAPLGMVHVRDRIVGRAPLYVGESVAVRVSARDLRPHRRGALVDVVAELRRESDAEPVWSSVSTYLSRGAHAPDVPPLPGDHVDIPDLPDGGAAPGARAGDVSDADDAASVTDVEVSLPADTGRRFAGVSGDRNPIHLHPLTARLFGFGSMIVHGRWLTARSVAALGTLPDSGRVEVTSEYRAPMPLPAVMRIVAEREGAQARVWCLRAGKDRVSCFTEVVTSPSGQ